MRAGQTTPFHGHVRSTAQIFEPQPACQPLSGLLENRVRVLLQNKVDGKYFQNAQSWVTDSEEAQDFLTTECALDKARRLRLAEVQVVLKWPEMSHPRYDVVIPIAPQRPRPRP